MIAPLDCALYLDLICAFEDSQTPDRNISTKSSLPVLISLLKLAAPTKSHTINIF